MFSPFVYMIISLHPFLNTLSEVAHPAGHENSPWFVGCVNASDPSVLGLHTAEGDRDLDPVACSARCLRAQYQAAALTLDSCHCSNHKLCGFAVSECFNTSSSGGSKHVRAESERQSVLNLPVGAGQGIVALYRTEGPFLHSISLSASPDRVQAGETFVVKVSGNLAGRPHQPTGISTVGKQDLAYVTVDILDATSKSQSSNLVSVLDDGSFVVTSDWIFDTPGKYEINVRVSNTLSTLSSTLLLSVSQPSPDGLVISVLHSPLGVLSSIPLQQTDSMQVAFLGVPVTLQVHVGEGLATGFCWWFTQEGSEEIRDSNDGRTCVKTACFPDYGCLNSTLNWTFETEGIHTVSVNASSTYGWTQQTIHIAVVRSAVSDLKVSVSGTQLTPAESISVDVELFTTKKHLLVLNLTYDENYINKSELIPTHANVSLEVVSDARSMDSRVVWTFSLDDAVVVNGTKSGCYNVTVKACTPISCDSFQTHIVVPDLVGELVLNTSSVITTNQKVPLCFSIAAGSDVTASLLVNTTLLYRHCSYAIGEEILVVLLLNHTGTVAVELQAKNRVSSQNKSVRVCVEGNRKPPPQVKVNPNWQPPTSPVDNLADIAVSVYAAKQAYPTNTDIILMAVADVPDPVEYIWHYGDSTSARTTSKTISKRYNVPGRFDVVVVASSGQTSITSKPFPLEVQRAVKLNRLVHLASVLQNQTVTVSCRVNGGTNLTFLWSFGDGSSRQGQSTEEHIFHRTGEFPIEVTVSNLVSSASLSSRIFVEGRPCQPPPVKNMGPRTLQVQRYEVVRLGVTYDNEINCDIAGGLHYTWTLFDSVGQIWPLPLIDTHRQSLILPSHLLHHDTYNAVARVQVIGSVVYSNYSVRVKVMRSHPVAFIQGGTNIFINNRNTTMVTLDGQRSYDPDFPLKPLRYSWTCKPLSSISSSCFNQHIPTSSPVLTFPVGSLKYNFDQFQFTLTVHSGELSASSESFLTITPNVPGRVSVYCPQCQGDELNWDQPFTVSAWCEDCGVSSESIRYAWHLYRVNASSKPVAEVPFCHTVDLSAPSTVIKSPATSPQTASAIDTVNYNHDSAPVSLTEITSETRTKKQNVDLTDREELLYHPLGEFDPAENYPLSTEHPPLALENSDVLYSDLSKVFSDDSDSSADWEFSFPVLEAGDAGGRLDSDYDLPLTSADEGDPGISAGRPTGVAGENFSLGEDSAMDPVVHNDEGSNLVDSRPSVVTQEQTLLDLPRDPVDTQIFESYTFTGTSSLLLSFRPFSLRPGSRFMLEVTAKSQDSFLGRTQLFLKTKPAPKDMTCQVQPVEGVELHTQFSIFCTSGKEDLVYDYSFSVGGRPRRKLYQGRDFQYYFRLPSGDASDDYRVTIYTKIRTASGTATKPCPVTVHVQPSFLRGSSSLAQRDPDLELSECALRNLSALVQLGNSVEIRNYISLLASILNRLSLDTEANTRTHRHIRSVLICTVCDLESSEQQSMEDNICVLKDILQMINKISLVSARRVTAHIQAISDQSLESSTPVLYNLDSRTLNNLITVLSYTLQAVVNSHESILETSHNVFITQAPESDSPKGENIRTVIGAPHGCDSHIGKEGLISTKQVVRLVADIHQTASDLMLKYILLHEVQEHKVSTGLITLYATYQNSTVISSGSTTFYIPDSLIQQLLGRASGERENERHRRCVLSVLTELDHSPYTWAPSPTKLSGPVVNLNLYKCGTRRKIRIQTFIQPVNVELQIPQRNKSSGHEYVLLHNQVNYHSFNITQEHLQQTIKFSVVFMPLSNKVFPIMLLFRMLDKPTTSMHHLHRIHTWQSNTTSITLPPSYLSAAGVGHLALLNAGKAPRHKHLNAQIRYSLTVDSSSCLSWDSHQGAWTHRGCRTQQTDTTAKVTCSCLQLRPLTVAQHQLEGSHDTGDLDTFLSVSRDLTVPGVLVLCVCLYVLALVLCKKADVAFEKNQRVHYLPDNSTSDPYLYAATIHTGLCSAAYMSAKVYIVLYGEDGSSQTRELHVPGCTLFRRNTQDTFILRTANSLGPVWGVHIWHDNSGSSPNWYLKRVEVCEVNRDRVKGRAWLFVGQCWLAASKGDGKVEIMLRVCVQGIGFMKMLSLKLSDYLADCHLWICVFSCPRPNPFTHTQRLTVCLLLLLGYACVNTVIISQMDEQLPFDLGITDASAISLITGVVSVLAVLPAATVISFLFRWRKVKLMGSGAQHDKDFFEGGISVEDSTSKPHLSQTDVQLQTQAASFKKHQGTDLLSHTHKEPIQSDLIAKQENTLTCGSSMGPKLDILNESKFHGVQRDHLSIIRDENIISLLRGTSRWCHCLAWALCLLLSLSCLVLSTVLGMRFSSSKVLLWIHSLFFSLTSCIFFIQPFMILTVAAMVSLWYRKRPDFHSFLGITEFEIEASILRSHSGVIHPEEQFSSTAFPPERCSQIEELLRARQRARYLRLVRPLTPAELRKTSGKKRRETLIWNNFRDLSVCVLVLFLVLCITYGSSFNDHYPLNKFVREKFTRNHNNAFMLIPRHEDWWKWTQTTMLNLLYKNGSTKTESHILIGEPILWKMEAPRSFQSLDSIVNIVPECLHLFLLGSRTLTYPQSSVNISMAKSPRTCGHLGCYSIPSATVGLGHTKFDAVSRLKHLHSSGWLGRETVALKVQFTLYSPAPNLFTSVTLLTEQSPTGGLLPSSKVQSVRVYHTPAVWDYVVMMWQLLFLLLSLLQLCHQVYIVRQQGLMGYCKRRYNWLEVSLLKVTLVYYVYCIYLSAVTMDVVDVLQRHNYRRHVDVSFLATCEQHIRTLCGVILFLLTTKCLILLMVNSTLASPATLCIHSLSSLFWPMISGLILLGAFSCLGNLLSIQNWAFCSISRCLQTLLCHYQGLRASRGLLLSGYDFLYSGVLSLSSTVVWTSAVMAVVSSMVRSSRRSQGRRMVTVAQIARCVRQKFSEITLQQRPPYTEDHMEGRNYYLEEFESLVDELLFRVDTLSNSLHHTLTSKAQDNMEESPAISHTQESSNVDLKDFVRIKIMEETLINDKTDSHGELLLTSHPFRYKLQQKILQLLQQRKQSSNNPSSQTVVTTENLQQPGKNQNHKELQTHLREQNSLPLSESESLIRVWSEDVLEKQSDHQWTKTKNDDRSQTQAKHREVVVEALVHKAECVELKETLEPSTMIVVNR